MDPVLSRKSLKVEAGGRGVSVRVMQCKKLHSLLLVLKMAKAAMSQGAQAPLEAGKCKAGSSPEAFKEKHMILAQGDPFWTSDL